MMETFTFHADCDDARDIHAAVAYYQRRNVEMKGALLGEGESDALGAYLGEIARQWLESHGALRQGGES